MGMVTALAHSVGELSLLVSVFTSPDFSMGGRGEGGVSLSVALCLALVVSISSSHRRSPLEIVLRRSPSPLLTLVSVLMLMLAGCLAVWWLYGHRNDLAMLATGVLGTLLAVYAWNMKQSNRCLEAKLQEVCELSEQRDSVTGLWNHYAVYSRLEQMVCSAAEQGYPLSVIRLDVDRFALYNVTHGPAAGNELLRQVAHVVTSLLPADAVVGRYDADELLIGLPRSEREQAIDTAHRLREEMLRTVQAEAGTDRAIPVSVSLGVACFPCDATDVRELLSVAEHALVLAKRNGQGVASMNTSWSNRYAVYENGTFSALEALVVAIDNKDHYTRQHSEDVTEYAQWIAEELGMSDEQRRLLCLAGLLHDVGKIGIPDEVLMKPCALTAAEYELVKYHSLLGEAMLSTLPDREQIAPIVRAHHERWDGKGYPDGLRGEEIPLLARALAVADAFSAMTTDRPYRRGMDWQSAIAELERQRGKQFDPDMVDAFTRIARRRFAGEPETASDQPLAA